MSVNPFPGIFIRDKFRVANVDTPEIRHSQCAQEKELGILAKEYVQGILAHARWITVEIHEIGKYGRPIATILIHNVNLGDALVNNGLAKRWSGKDAKPSWCDEA